MLKNISVITVVYNEEKRMENFCKSFSWSDDFIIVDKTSTDRTKEIAQKYTTKIIDAPYSDTGDELKIALKKAKNEWVMIVTASELISPKLVKECLELINKKEFNYEVILLPFKLYMFGLDYKYSPWESKYSNRLAKKDVIILGDKVHEEYDIKSNKIYKIDYEKNKVLQHLTHENMDIFMERHIRYSRAEKNKYTTEKDALKIATKEILKSILKVIKKRTIFKGWDGLGLSLAYISYFIMKYLFLWEKFRLEGHKKYQNLRKINFELWEKNEE
ncbi:MAG: glycosyltransferase [Cetobacterium sp.]|uniref:glycosyltransferase n=1 Tax=Cetobacterium sp. TaxID=2071632 RepID=UPI003F3144DD